MASSSESKRIEPFIKVQDRRDILKELVEAPLLELDSAIKKHLAAIESGSKSKDGKDGTIERAVHLNVGSFGSIFFDADDKGKDASDKGKDASDKGKDASDKGKDASDKGKDTSDGKESSDGGGILITGDPALLDGDRMQLVFSLQTTRINSLLRRSGAII
jgi:hypothetical protein